MRFKHIKRERESCRVGVNVVSFYATKRRNAKRALRQQFLVQTKFSDHPLIWYEINTFCYSTKYVGLNEKNHHIYKQIPTAARMMRCIFNYYLFLLILLCVSCVIAISYHDRDKCWHTEKNCAKSVTINPTTNPPNICVMFCTTSNHNTQSQCGAFSTRNNLHTRCALSSVCMCIHDSGGGGGWARLTKRKYAAVPCVQSVNCRVDCKFCKHFSPSFSCS